MTFGQELTRIAKAWPELEKPLKMGNELMELMSSIVGYEILELEATQTMHKQITAICNADDMNHAMRLFEQFQHELTNPGKLN